MIKYPETPDGKYFVVRGRLWRKSNPALDEANRTRLVHDLMSARRAVREAANNAVLKQDARRRVDAAKVALGERGPVWWDDSAPDYSRHLARTTPYAAWFASLSREASRPPNTATSGLRPAAAAPSNLAD